MLSPIWEGLRTRRWTGPELEEIKAGLRRVDLPRGLPGGSPWRAGDFHV